jgi:hypothetical protein
MFRARDDGSNGTNFAYVHFRSTDATNGSEDGGIELGCAASGTLRDCYVINEASDYHAWLLDNAELMRLTPTGLGVGGIPETQIHVQGAGAQTLTLESSNNLGILRLERTDTGGDGNYLGGIYFYGDDDADNPDHLYASITTAISDASSGQEDGQMLLNVMVSGSTLEAYRIKADEYQRWLLDGSELMRLTPTGLGVAVTPTCPLDVDQTASGASVPVLKLDQADVSEEFIRFVGQAAAATLTQSIVAEADVTTATRAGFLKCYVQDDGNQITDQSYYIPIFTLA